MATVAPWLDLPCPLKTAHSEDVFYNLPEKEGFVLVSDTVPVSGHDLEEDSIKEHKEKDFISILSSTPGPHLLLPVSCSSLQTM